MSAARSPKRSAERENPRIRPPSRSLDAVLLLAVISLAALLMVRAGTRRAVELMPWPDGLEYAAMAANIHHGLGPVLHFGGYSYPARYTEGYPLMLAACALRAGAGVGVFPVVGLLFGLASIAALYLLARSVLGRPAAFIASLILALSPVFITYSTLVLSDVPTLAVTLFAAASFCGASQAEAARESRAAMFLNWAIFGLVAGFTVMIRPTNAVILAGVALALVMVPPGGAGMKIGQIAAALAAFAIAFAIAPLWQLHQNAVHLGGAFRNGYAWWVPEVYGATSKVFNLAYLFGPTMPRNPHGNFVVYAATLLGVDGLLGDQGDPRFFLYPFAAAMFAIIGCVAIVRAPGHRVAKRLMWFGLGFLGALTALYMIYLFTEAAFLLPATFILFIAAGYGAVAANRWMRDVLSTRRRAIQQTAGIACVIALDLMLAGSLAAEAAVRLEATPQRSVMVPELLDAGVRMPAGATVVSNISLQFLELYIPGAARNFIGLDSIDPGERFTDYHLHRLYVKRSRGWDGPVPPVVFDSESMSKPTADAVAAAARQTHAAYLLLCAPESSEYGAILKDEMDRLNTLFELAPVLQTGELALFRIKPR
jgi:Dolichyl-phosphate-mannose-protein mannosyltransferase